jgi:hypothetical protein
MASILGKRWNQTVINTEVGWLDIHVGHWGNRFGSGHLSAKFIQADRFTAGQADTQAILDRLLAFVGGELEDLQIHLDRDRFTVVLSKQVVSEAKVATREHLFAETVVSERARFPHQRINHVPVIDARSMLADQSPHRLNFVALVRHRDRLGANSHIHFHADQATGN